MKVLVLLLLLAVAVNSQKSFITLKNKECESIALNLNGEIFGHKAIYYKYISILVVDASPLNFTNSIIPDHEFALCVNEISEDEIIHVSPLHSAAGDNEKHWQLKRINVRNLPLPDTFHRFENKDKSHVYIIDSGIDGDHPDFKGKLAPKNQHKNFIDHEDYCSCTEQGPLCDCCQHGTHCAGLVASPEAGYNINTTLHSAKVFDQTGSASWATVLAAMDWVIEAHKKFNPKDAGIVSMSLGGGFNSAINQAANKIVENGLFLAVAAGNSNKDSCTGSPSSADKAYTVGASDINDNRAYFSEFGNCVDIFAPGLDIWSCKPGGGYQFMSGTSMATPFVAGFASYVATYYGITNPVEIANKINEHASKGVVQNAKSNANNLPYDNLSEESEIIEYFFRNTLKSLLTKK